jgi:hypothetical protein
MYYFSNGTLVTMNKSLLSLLVFWTGISVGQTTSERFVHCLGADTFSIEKVSELIIGDTIVKEYFDHSHLNNPDDSTFRYYFFNDSAFIKFDNSFYIIGDDNAQIGDVWHPIRYLLNSYTDTTENCPLLMNLEVTDIDTVFIDGVQKKYFTLNDLDWSTPNLVDHKYLEGIGATVSGPYYNFSQEMPCDIFTEVSITFISYHLDDYEFKEGECITSILDDKLTENGIVIYPNPAQDRVWVDLTPPAIGLLEIQIHNTLGIKVFQQTIEPKSRFEHHSINLGGYERGTYILSIYSETDFFRKRLVIEP